MRHRASVSIVSVVLGIGAMLVFGQAVARAQTTPVASKPDNRVSLDTAVHALATSSGETIVAETALLPEKVPVVPKVGADRVEGELTILVAALPKGAEWLKLMLPPPPAGRTYRAEELIELALAQARVFGTVGAATPPGTIEVYGRRISGDEAAGVVKALNLRPVYVVVNASAASVATMNEAEQKEWAKQQAKQLLDADPDARKQLLKQLFQIPLSVMQGLGGILDGMPKDQRAALVQSLGGTVDGDKMNLSFTESGGDK